LATAETERKQRLVKVTELGAEAREAIAKQLDIDDLTDAAESRRAALSELRAQVEVCVSLARSGATQSRQPIRIALLVAVILIPLVAVAANHWLATDQAQVWFAKLGAISAQITAALAGLATWLRKALASFSDCRKHRESVRDWINQLLQAKTAKEAADLQVAAAQVEITRLEVEREKISLEIRKDLPGLDVAEAALNCVRPVISAARISVS